ncbi:MAG: apolipoprotein N-acyltransferase [Lapillicoccus sp.]
MLRRLLLALLSGACLWLAFPGHDFWVLAPVGVALLAVATRGTSTRRGFLFGFVSGMVSFVLSLSWSGVYVGALPWIALSVSQALFVAALGAACAFLQTGRDGLVRTRPLVIALAWVAQEALRDRIPYGGFPWVRLAFSQAASPLGRLAALGGAPLVTFGVALSGGLLAAGLVALGGAVTARRTSPTPPAPAQPARVGVLATLAGVAVALAGVLVPLPTDGTPTQVMAVQGNVPQAGLEFNAQRRAVLDNHVDGTLAGAAAVSAGRTPQPDLVVWPENSSDIDPVRNSDAAAQITRAVAAIKAPVILGALLEEPLPNVSNASLLYLPGEGLVGRYIKQHPVPFAEYIPQRAFFRLFSDKVDLVRADFAAGTTPVVFRVPNAAGGEIIAGPTICFEVAYDDLVRENVTLGANLLLVQTNNATFGFTDESVQQLAISRIRAMEHGRSVVHISTVGVSALITPDGTLHQATSLYTRAVLSGQLPLRTARTVATVVGPWPEYAGCLLLLLLMAAWWRRPQGGTKPAT